MILIDKVFLGCVLASVACSAPKLGGDGSIQPDAAPDVRLEPPILGNLPAATPLGTVRVQGSTNASKVVIADETGRSQIVGVLQGGFCYDLPLAEAGKMAFSVYSASNGSLSEPTPAEVTRDALATRPANATCGGEDVTGTCEPVAEDCSNNKDDDCDGFRDNCDSDCNQCEDDLLEPNDDASNVPLLDRGTQPDLKLCPCREDWFAFQRDAGQRIRVRAEFSHNQSDIEMELCRAAINGNGCEGNAVARSASSDDDEEITYMVPEGGTYYLHVFMFGSQSNARANYSLNVF